MFTTHKAVLFGIDGKTLTQEERQFFSATPPLGFMLFYRNIESKAQVKALVQSLREVVGNDNVLILIDQEGGRVARLRSPSWYHPPAASVFGKIAEINLETAKEALKINFVLVALDLLELGINVNAVPVLDVPSEDAHDVIGDRAFSTNKEIVAELGRVVCETLLKHNVVPIIKHIPGHGRARADSHKELPVVETSLEVLNEIDFYPFRALNNMPAAMTAHVLYKAIDSDSPATSSRKAIDVIRTTIGFNGLLFSDCITMAALPGSMAERAHRAIDAGCDIILHSRYTNGSIAELHDVMANIPFINVEQSTALERLFDVPSVDVSIYDRAAMLADLQAILHRYDCTSQDNIEGTCSGAVDDPTDR